MYSMPKFRIYPKSLIAQGVVVEGYITNNTHTMLQLSGVPMLHVSQLAQMGALNKSIANNAVVINLNEFTFDILD
jgi:hypothetical protein